MWHGCRLAADEQDRGGVRRAPFGHSKTGETPSISPDVQPRVPFVLKHLFSEGRVGLVFCN